MNRPCCPTQMFLTQTLCFVLIIGLFPSPLFSSFPSHHRFTKRKKKVSLIHYLSLITLNRKIQLHHNLSTQSKPNPYSKIVEEQIYFRDIQNGWLFLSNNRPSLIHFTFVKSPLPPSFPLLLYHYPSFPLLSSLPIVLPLREQYLQRRRSRLYLVASISFSLSLGSLARPTLFPPSLF